MEREPGQFAVVCPCCGGELLIDLGTKAVLHHIPAAPRPAITDLAVEAGRLRQAEAAREEVFQKSLQAERTREERMGRKFDELLKRAREGPADKPLKDIDL